MQYEYETLDYENEEVFALSQGGSANMKKCKKCHCVCVPSKTMSQCMLLYPSRAMQTIQRYVFFQYVTTGIV